MRVPMKMDYGVRALVELAQREGGPPTNTAEIASHGDWCYPFCRSSGLYAVAVGLRAVIRLQ
jgi:DNA-binding IscR family transcriptional regulator